MLNLLLGCIAIVFILQTGETIVQLDATGASQVYLPEKIWWGALCIYAAAAVDFLDGFLARLLKASSGMGKQLDSLSDVISFGVAPALIIYQLLRIGYAQETYGLDISTIVLFPAFIYSGAVAWRLARFNISPQQSNDFTGVPSPATGLLIASFPLIMLFSQYNVQSYFINPYILYAILLLVSYLLVCKRKFIAVKFTNYAVKNNRVTYPLLLVSVVLILWLKWLSVPAIFVLYLIASGFSNNKKGEQGDYRDNQNTVTSSAS